MNKNDSIFMIHDSNNDSVINSGSALNLEKYLKSGIQNSILNSNLLKNKAQSNKKKKFIFTNNFLPTFNFQTPIININSDKQQKKVTKIDNLIKDNRRNKINLKQNQQIKLKKNGRFIKNKKISHNMETIAEKEEYTNKFKPKNNNINTKIDILSQSDFDLQDMDYEEAVIKDKRSYLRMYWAFLVDTQIILGTFCTDNYLDLFTIKLSFLVCTFQISFFFNALFYTDEYISDAYHNDGVLDFISGLPKSIYSFVATLITTNLLRMLSSSKSELMNVIREKWKNKNYLIIVRNKLRKLRKKLIVYFILVFLLGLFFIYYVTCFCAVYRNSQRYWFIGCLESFGMDSGVAVIICIFLALFRYISIKNHIKCFYCLANIISAFL